VRLGDGLNIRVHTELVDELLVNHLGEERAKLRDDCDKQYMMKGESMYQRGYPLWFIGTKALCIFKSSHSKSLAFLRGYCRARREKIPQVVNILEKRFVNKFNIHRALYRSTGLKTPFYANYI